MSQCSSSPGPGETPLLQSQRASHSQRGQSPTGPMLDHPESRWPETESPLPASQKRSRPDAEDAGLQTTTDKDVLCVSSKDSGVIGVILLE